MSHTTKVTLIADQMIKFKRDEINVHDIITLVVTDSKEGDVKVKEICVKTDENEQGYKWLK